MRASGLTGVLRIQDAKVNGSGLLGTVLDGAYKGGHLGYRKDGTIVVFGTDVSVPILANLADYLVVDEKRKGGAGAGAAVAGLALLGPLGLAAGAYGLRKKRVAVMRWKDGRDSAVEVRSGTIHNAITQHMGLRKSGF